MRLTIVVDDGTVSVEGKAHKVDLSDVPHYIHAVQWNGVKGTIEFAVDDKGRKLPNLQITDMSPFMFLVQRWNAAQQDEDERVAQEELRIQDQEKKRQVREMTDDNRTAVQRKLDQPS